MSPRSRPLHFCLTASLEQRDRPVPFLWPPLLCSVCRLLATIHLASSSRLHPPHLSPFFFFSSSLLVDLFSIPFPSYSFIFFSFFSSFVLVFFPLLSPLSSRRDFLNTGSLAAILSFYRPRQPRLSFFFSNHTQLERPRRVAIVAAIMVGNARYVRYIVIAFFVRRRPSFRSLIASCFSASSQDGLLTRFQ